MRKFLATCVLLSCLLGCRSQQRIHNRAFDATFAVFVETQDEEGFICTATAYERTPNGYHLITAGHCVTGYKDAVTFSVAKQVNAPRRTVRVVKAQRTRIMDFAILELDTRETYATIPLAPSYTEQIGDRIFSPNFSEGLDEQIAEGVIASDVTTDGYMRFIFHAFGGPGMSGAAIVSERSHKIVGVVTTRFKTNIGLGGEPIDLFYLFLIDSTSK